MCSLCVGRNKALPGYGDMAIGRYSSHLGKGAIGFWLLLWPPGFKGLKLTKTQFSTIHLLSSLNEYLTDPCKSGTPMDIKF